MLKKLSSRGTVWKRSNDSSSSSSSRSSSQPTDALVLASSSGSHRTQWKPKKELDRAIREFEKAIEGHPNAADQFRTLCAGPLPDHSGALLVAEDLSRECAKQSRLRNGVAMKTAPFFDLIRQFAPLGDIVIGGAQNLIASGVWAAIRLALEVTFLEAICFLVSCFC